ncbi:MAG: carboxypeptidase-like regulatory domain-containing protein, partial [Bacteroidota bacterium]
MKKIKFALTFFLTILFYICSFTQSGIVKGIITDALSNEPIGFANVLVLGADQGTTTDIDGTFEITGLTPGLYDVRASFIGYEEA